MSKFLVKALLLLSLVSYGTNLATSWSDKDFFRYCLPSRCSKDGPEVRFPLRLEPSSLPSSCGTTYIELACRGHETILVHPVFGPCKVTAIDYRRASMNILPLVYSSPCPLGEIFSKSIQLPVSASADYLEEYTEHATLVCCSRVFTPRIWAVGSIAGPIPCLSNSTHLSYLVDAYVSMSVLPLECKVVSDDSIQIPIPADGYGTVDQLTFKVHADRIINFADMTLSWLLHENCQTCEHHGWHCGFSSQRNEAFCEDNPDEIPLSSLLFAGSSIKVVAATSSAITFVILLLMAVTVVYPSLKTRYNEEVHLKVEMFLRTYGTSKPTRYTFPEVKKIAKRFKDKLGQGGFGSVYKGELRNGVPVAVKMLESSTEEGEEFINEVATIGLIHHTNIVRLLGFCSEGTRRALIYEFMPNESLEKYIFSHVSNISRQLLVPDKMLDIALGIARGMEYLHQGCNQRILHFDIKPHNILLDYNFKPKISNFGLAKLCARDQSIITLTAARGIMGYIAPELYSRNFGGVSYKSDVYSFGMLVLEMVSGRRNSDPSVEN
ncbi:hypothetical protein CFC21_045762 [Triticum aestivum]|uniref:non-specific serine/threonine protein kinase n=2 Tax=Triticum aestivum TaxID=4565 RepID=A0A9R1FUJ3_WHEAT|nr:rust resistance kinase Lr10-like [Triticum aestivum]KAF7034793.1 hypothetical protein CFC21_045762 [Triticum aestivum]